MVSSITHHAVFYEFMHEIFTLTVALSQKRANVGGTQLHLYHSCAMLVKVPPHRLRVLLSSANKRFVGVAIRSRSIKSTFAKTPQKVGEPVTVCRTYTTSSVSLLKSIEDLLAVGFLADREVISEEECKQSAEQQQ